MSSPLPAASMQGAEIPCLLLVLQLSLGPEIQLCVGPVREERMGQRVSVFREPQSTFCQEGCHNSAEKTNQQLP